MRGWRKEDAVGFGTAFRSVVYVCICVLLSHFPVVAQAMLGILTLSTPPSPCPVFRKEVLALQILSGLSDQNDHDDE